MKRLLNNVRSSYLDISDNAWQLERQMQDPHTACPIVRCVLNCVTAVTQSSLICCVTYVRSTVQRKIVFVCEYAVQLNTEDFHCESLYKEYIVQKFL